MKSTCVTRSYTNSSAVCLSQLPALRLALLLMLVATLGGGVVGCRATIQTDAMKLGLVAPFEGGRRDLGYAALAGVRRAIAEVNAAGGIAGRPIELVALNDEDSPAEARRQVTELAVDPAVVGAIAGWSTETAAAALPAYRDVGLPLAIPLSWLEAPPGPCQLRVAPPPEAIVDALLRRLGSLDGISRVAVAIEPASLADSVEEALRAAGYQVLLPDAVRADAWALALGYEETARAIQWASGAPVFLLNDLYLPLVDALSGEASTDVTGLTGVPEDKAYEAARRLIEALRCAGESTRPAVCGCLVQ